MKQQRVHRLIFAVVFLSHLPICPATESPAPTDPNRYLNAVRTFADNVLKYGRDTYGPKHKPLFFDHRDTPFEMNVLVPRIRFYEP